MRGQAKVSTPPEEDEELSVSEKGGTYSSMGKPKEDTDVFVGREDLNPASASHATEQRRPNRATPDPMAQLREQAKANAPKFVASTRSSSGPKWLALLALGGGVVVTITSIVVLIATFVLRPPDGDSDELNTLSPVMADEQPDGEPAVKPKPKPGKRADEDMGRVPVRKGLRGE